MAGTANCLYNLLGGVEMLSSVIRKIRNAEHSSATSLAIMTGDLETLPDEIARVRLLRELSVVGNISRLPATIGQLKFLRSLHLTGNKLAALPPELGNLNELTDLSLSDNQIKELPPEIGRLRSLRRLFLGYNKLAHLPQEIGQLSSLLELELQANAIQDLPPDLGQLVRLKKLNLSKNSLSQIPQEISQLSDLEDLNLDFNNLTTLPPELGRISRLLRLQLVGNSLQDPPSAIAQSGTAGILEYLRARDIGTVRQWIAKLVVVGQGGVGKTCLLRALRSEAYREGEVTTHGIEVRNLLLKHPSRPTIEMSLNTWDFGGQEIYHATHQFFLSNRSLFLVVWNARQGFIQSRIHYWLDTINSLAPDSPILLVATQTDERDPDLPLQEIRDRYPQVRDLYAVSSKTGAGIEKLREAITVEASNLPLMGQPWPADWRKAADVVRRSEEPYMSALAFKKLLTSSGVRDQAANILGGWLHELGEILYFQGSAELEDTVILKPTWATSIVSRVLESHEVAKSNGILTTRHMRGLWEDLDYATQHFCLRLMEKFDLSYRTLDDKEISIVVERLPFEPPDYRSKWENVGNSPGTSEVSMRFVLGATMPAGVPTWFIARQHRFSIGLHWRTGVLFADSGDRHLALLEAHPHDRQILLMARGPFPQNFFSLLRDGLELTLARFPGLRIERRVPCPGHSGDPCNHEFSYDNLLRAMERTPPRTHLECPVGLEDVGISKLLYGIHSSSHDEVVGAIRDLGQRQESQHRELVVLLSQQRELIQREFTSTFKALQGNADLECPNIFILRYTKRGLVHGLSGPQGQSFEDVARKIVNWPLVELHLLCQQPGCWHVTTQGGHYTLGVPPKWLQEALPTLQKMLECLKLCPSPKAKATAQVAAQVAASWKKDLKLTEALLTYLTTESKGTEQSAEEVNGAALRAIRRLLLKLDPERSWGNLRKILTPEGHWLWLCDEHAAAYRR